MQMQVMLDILGLTFKQMMIQNVSIAYLFGSLAFSDNFPIN